MTSLPRSFRTSAARPSLALLSCLGVLAAAGVAEAQCDCDHEIGLSDTAPDGRDMGVMPGDRVCVMAGPREYLRLNRMIGSADAPVTIVNCGGVVDIRNEDRAYALVVEGESRYFHLTGTGTPGVEYGFRASAPDRDPWSGVGLWLLGRVTDYEVDHVEVYETGFAGVSAKTDPTCDGLADQDVFVQENVELHHIWAHDTGGEGFYVGSTKADGQTITCDGTSEVHQPHFLDGISIHDNLIENTGWDGMQVGMARSRCEVYRNVIRNVGSEGVEYQQQGLQIGTFSACEVHHNVITDGPVMGIIVLGAATSTFSDNLIVRFGANGIYANHRDRDDGAAYRFYFNTIVDPAEHGIQVFGPNLSAVEVANNLVVGAATAIAAGGDVAFTEDHNLDYATTAEAGLVGAGDFHLAEDSPARGAGRTIEGRVVDLDGRGRAEPPSVGVYEYADDAVAVPDAGPPVGSDAGGPPVAGDAGAAPCTDALDGGDGATTCPDSGCGCSAPGHRAGSGWLIAFFVTGALFLRRRRS